MSLYSDYKPRKTRNFLDNASFFIRQLGAGPFTVSGMTADRWGLYHYLTSGSVAVSFSTNNNPPNKAGMVNHSNMILTATSQKTTYSAGEYVSVNQTIEGWNFLGLAGKMATFSFWVKATVPGIYSVSFRNSIYTASYVKEFTINSSDTWEYKIINIDFEWGTGGSGNWNFTNSAGLHVAFTTACGSTYSTSTMGQWLSGNYVSSTNQVVFSQSIDNTFSIARPQLELGIVPTPFEILDVFTEYNRALRYYEYKYVIAPAVQVANGSGVAYFNLEFAEKRVKPINIAFVSPRIWKTTWRTATSTFYNTNAGYPGRALILFYDSANTDYTTSFSNLCDGGFGINSTLP
jgi:hypothetical protein